MATAPDNALVCLGPVKRGRPSDYSLETTEEICERIAAGELLQDICEDEHMPAVRTVSRWIMQDRDGFFGRYARAREAQAHLEADQTRSIADDKTILPEHKRIMVDARKWRAERLNRRVYGQSVKHEIEPTQHPAAEQLPPGLAWLSGHLPPPPEGETE